MSFQVISITVTALAAAHLTVFVTAAPAQAPLVQVTTESDQSVDAYSGHLFGGRYAEALAVAESLEFDGDDGRALVAIFKASALLGLKRDAEARSLIAESDRLAPQNPHPSTVLFTTALVIDRLDIAADMFDRLIARFPDVVHGLDVQLIWHFHQNEPKDEIRRNEDRRIALARLGYGADAPHGDHMALRAVDILTKRGDLSGASELLRYIDEPQVIEDLLIQKKYSALWPQIEAMAGPNLASVRESSVRTAQLAFEKSPEDPEKLQHLANALRHANRHEEAIALRSKLPNTRETMALVGEQAGWAVNNIALALHEMGRAEDADRLFASLNEAPIEDSNWRVSMLINRLELLVADGAYAKALPLIEPTANTPGSPYAEQLVRRLRYCTMIGLGRTEDAAKLLPDMLDHAKDAYHATVDGLLCAGNLDKAEEIALAAFKDDDAQAQFIRTLQPRPLTSDDPSIWQGRWTELRRRPKIAAEFDRLGRDMPERFLPPPIDQD